jgi:HD-GYP domain-containing protein (c-di-GMP phosphodiesterase class II)
MVRYNIDSVKDGMVVAAPLYNHDHKLMVTEGFTLKNEHIHSLIFKNVASLYIDIDGTEAIQPAPLLSSRAQSKLVHIIQDTYEKILQCIVSSSWYGEDVMATEELILNKKKLIGHHIDNSRASEVISEIIDEIKVKNWDTVSLEKIWRRGKGLYERTYNVTLLSLCLGLKYQYSSDEMIHLGLGALFYDIGMLVIPDEILRKEALTPSEREFLNGHPVYGYSMLSTTTTIPPVSAAVALAHHEREDGEGYPRHLKGDNTPPVKHDDEIGRVPRFAEIVAVADSYEMVINGRKHFSSRRSISESVLNFLSMRTRNLNLDIVQHLLSFITLFPVGSRVRIVDDPEKKFIGCYGVVKKVQKELPFEPTILVYEDSLMIPLPRQISIDLRDKNFEITFA